MNWPAASVLIAAMVASIAAFQAAVAWRKLRFDLFAKRFETWDALNDAIDARREACEELSPEAPEENDGGKARKAFWRLRRQMVLLFPPEVNKHVDRVDAALLALGQMAIAREHHANADAAAHARFIEQYDRYIEASSLTFSAQSDLMGAARAYMRQYGWLELHGTPAWRTLRAHLSRMTSSFRNWR